MHVQCPISATPCLPPPARLVRDPQVENTEIYIFYVRVGPPCDGGCPYGADAGRSTRCARLSAGRRLRPDGARSAVRPARVVDDVRDGRAPHREDEDRHLRGPQPRTQPRVAAARRRRRHGDRESDAIFVLRTPRRRALLRTLEAIDVEYHFFELSFICLFFLLLFFFIIIFVFLNYNFFFFNYNFFFF